MSNRRFIVAGQKTVDVGSSEPEFQGDNIWTGLYEDIHEQDPYFYSYSHFGIHEEMIKDSVRTDTYMNAITQNPHLFQGKVVLDIGCGTGILSIFATRAGAAHVYGIDAADVAYKAQEIVRDNGLADRITIIKAKVEEVELPVEKVDIIISEWMGYFLLYESMLDTVIYARDKWLKPEGLMFPDTAKHWFTALEDAEYKENKVGFWENVYGFDMSPMKELVMVEPIVDYVEPQSIVTTEHLLFTMDLKTVRMEDLNFAATYSLTATRNEYIHALVNWFDVEFNHGQKPFVLSTSPSRKSTHWKQTVFYLNDVLPAKIGEELRGSIAIRPNPTHHRNIDIKISYHFDGDKHSYHDVRSYTLK